MSTSHFMIVWKVQSWMPEASLSMNDGWKRTSGQRNRSLPMTLPSGSSYDFSSAVLDRVLERQHTALRLRLVADVRVLLVHADHDTRVLGAADDGREDGTRSVVAGEASLAHARAVVNHERLFQIFVQPREQRREHKQKDIHRPLA